MTPSPIGLFDSGVGGLTVVRSVHRLLPGHDLVYLGDTARVPYGNKSAETVTRFSLDNCRFLLDHGVGLIVVACNTASALALEELSRQISVPLIGMISTGAAAAVSRESCRHVGVIGTSATIESGAYPRAIQRLNPSVRVSSRACPLLVPLVEEGWISHEVTRQVLQEYLDPLVQDGIDTLVLGCTHYPLLKDLIADVAGPDVRLVDSADASALAVQDFLGSSSPQTTSLGSVRLFFTDMPRDPHRITGSFLGTSHASVEKAVFH